MKDWDVIIVGGGNAAYCAALAATRTAERAATRAATAYRLANPL